CLGLSNHVGLGPTVQPHCAYLEVELRVNTCADFGGSITAFGSSLAPPVSRWSNWPSITQRADRAPVRTLLGDTVPAAAFLCPAISATLDSLARQCRCH